MLRYIVEKTGSLNLHHFSNAVLVSWVLCSLFLMCVGVLIGTSGFTALEQESRGDKLWVPSGTRASEDYVSAATFF